MILLLALLFLLRKVWNLHTIFRFTLKKLLIWPLIKALVGIFKLYFIFCVNFAKNLICGNHMSFFFSCTYMEVLKKTLENLKLVGRNCFELEVIWCWMQNSYQSFNKWSKSIISSRQGRFSTRVSRGSMALTTQHPDFSLLILILNFWTSKHWENNFLLSQPKIFFLKIV